LGRGEPVRLRDVLERIGELTQATELFRFGVRPMRPNEPPEQVADVATAAAVLGWRAQISWQQGIAELCKATMELRG
jgi:nucleoside-diphosphate-sugar epimerase